MVKSTPRSSLAFVLNEIWQVTEIATSQSLARLRHYIIFFSKSLTSGRYDAKTKFCKSRKLLPEIWIVTTRDICLYRRRSRTITWPLHSRVNTAVLYNGISQTNLNKTSAIYTSPGWKLTGNWGSSPSGKVPKSDWGICFGHFTPIKITGSTHKVMFKIFCQNFQNTLEKFYPILWKVKH